MTGASASRVHRGAVLAARVVWLFLVLPLPAVYAAAIAQEGSATPGDVTAFRERRDLCDHFRGEDPYDAERRQFLIDNVQKYCTGTDKELARLKAKYRENEAISETLGAYEDRIESGN